MVGESALISAAQSGNLDAFNSLVLDYQDQVYSLAYRILGDPAGADDITQETFVSAYQKIHQFKGGNFRAWLLRIATNACYDELRRHKRRPTDSIDDDDYDIEADGRMTSTSESPESYTQRNELKTAIEECFEQLSDTYRLVAVMVDVQDYSYDEIADFANISLGTVKSRISRARASLRDCLKDKGELLPTLYRS